MFPFVESDDMLRSRSVREIVRLLQHAERLTLRGESHKFARASDDATLTRASGFSWRNYEFYAVDLHRLGGHFLRNDADYLHIGIWELIAGVLAVLICYIGDSETRCAIFRTANVNLFTWSGKSRPRQGVMCRASRAFLHRRILSNVEAIPRCIRIGHNRVEDGVTILGAEEIPARQIYMEGRKWMLLICGGLWLGNLQSNVATRPSQLIRF